MEMNGFRAPIRARLGIFPGIERKTPPQIALCRAFAARRIAYLPKDPAQLSLLKARAFFSPPRASTQKGGGV